MFFTLTAPLSLALEATRIGIEAQTVIALRLAGMAGLWDTPASEMTRMVVEKAEAALGALEASTRAALHGDSPEEVLQAGMTEIGRYTSDNLERLSRLGPALR